MSIATSTQWIGRHLVDGEWRDGAAELFEDRNPARFDEVLGVYPRGTAADVDAAVAAARRAFPAWRRASRIKRGDLLGALATLIRRDTDELAKIMARENGKLLNEARAEIVEGLHMVEYVFGTARQPTGEALASEIPDKDLFVRRKPRGVVAVITPWNFPFAVPLWMLGPSLLEGNTVVFKPYE
jgi:aldehyde dehydrogenase (NAD+)